MHIMQLEKRGCRFIHYGLSFFILVFISHLSTSEKIRYASDEECDRHSLDALYHEKYKLITNNIFADNKEFVSRVADLVADSLISVLGELPGRDVSDNEERKVHTQFKNGKSVFLGKVKKIQKNITSSWEALITSNFDLMYDNGKSSLKDYVNKTILMADSYSEARRSLDSILSTFIEFIKSTLMNSFYGIKMASEHSLKKEESEKKENQSETGDSSQTNKSKDEILKDKMVEIAKMILPGFLGKITVEVIQRNIDLKKKSGIKPDDRDSVLNDIEFDVLMIKSRIRAITQPDIPKDKGAVDLARRSIYTYWADMAEEMYKEKLRSVKSKDKSNIGRLYYRNLWQNEEETLETLMNLMEVFP